MVEGRACRAVADSVQLVSGSRKVAVKKLGEEARRGAAEELDLRGTRRARAEHGYIDVQTRPERRNAVKVLLFLDAGGSMDDHSRLVDELFSAARSEFKHLEHFYFHNCIYEALWKDNRRRWTETTPTWDVLNRYGRDYKAILLGDASMSPSEIAVPGRPKRHCNPELGHTWPPGLG